MIWVSLLWLAFNTFLRGISSFHEDSYDYSWCDCGHGRDRETFLTKQAPAQQEQASSASGCHGNLYDTGMVRVEGCTFFSLIAFFAQSEGAFPICNRFTYYQWSWYRNVYFLHSSTETHAFMPQCSCSFSVRVLKNIGNCWEQSFWRVWIQSLVMHPSLKVLLKCTQKCINKS